MEQRLETGDGLRRRLANRLNSIKLKRDTIQRVYRVHDDSTTGLANLKIVRLNRMGIRSIQNDALAECKRLTCLNLNFNRISSLYSS